MSLKRCNDRHRNSLLPTSAINAKRRVQKGTYTFPPTMCSLQRATFYYSFSQRNFLLVSYTNKEYGKIQILFYFQGLTGINEIVLNFI